MNEVNKSGLKIKVGPTSHQISDLEDYWKRNDFSKAFKSSKYNDLGSMVFTLNLTHKEIEYVWDGKYMICELKPPPFPDGLFEVTEISNTLKSIYRKT